MEAAARPRSRGRTFALWLGILGPAVIWHLRIVVSYILIPYACAADQIISLHIVSAVALLATLLLGLLAWRTWRAFRADPHTAQDRAVVRSRFLALFGVLSSATFAATILAEWVTVFFVHPCLTGGAPI